MACAVIDRAIQIHGGGGITDITPLPAFYAWARALRLADGPDEVHLRTVARQELARHPYPQGESRIPARRVPHPRTASPVISARRVRAISAGERRDSSDLGARNMAGGEATGHPTGRRARSHPFG